MNILSCKQFKLSLDIWKGESGTPFVYKLTFFSLVNTAEAKNDSLAPALSAVLGFFLVLLILAGLIYLMYRRNGGDPKMFPARILRGLGVPMVDTELATLRELPRNGIQLPNALYAVK